MDDEWKRAVEWLIPHVHDEDDPTSYKYFLKRRRSHDVRLNRFLSRLVLKTEVRFSFYFELAIRVCVQKSIYYRISFVQL